MLDCRSQAGILPENVILGNPVEISRDYKQKLTSKRYEIQCFCQLKYTYLRNTIDVNNWAVQGSGRVTPVYPWILLNFLPTNLSIKMTDFLLHPAKPELFLFTLSVLSLLWIFRKECLYGNCLCQWIWNFGRKELKDRLQCSTLSKYSPQVATYSAGCC